MSTFDDKEKAAENKYARDKEVEFRVHARTHKLLGLWVAGKMGLAGAQAEQYAQSLVASEMTQAAPNHLFDRVKQDLLSKNAQVTDHEIKQEIHRAEQSAREQIVGKKS